MSHLHEPGHEPKLQSVLMYSNENNMYMMMIHNNVNIYIILHQTFVCQIKLSIFTACPLPPPFAHTHTRPLCQTCHHIARALFFWQEMLQCVVYLVKCAAVRFIRSIVCCGVCYTWQSVLLCVSTPSKVWRSVLYNWSRVLQCGLHLARCVAV